MNRNEIISDLEQYFEKYELVDVLTYNKYGEKSWQFFDTNILYVLLLIRTGINRQITVNNWKWGGIYQERGLRTNLSKITRGKTKDNQLYLSAHIMAKAFDFKVKDMDSEDVRMWIVKNQSIFPCKIRLEHKKNGIPITWVHIDTKYLSSNPKVYLFDV